MTETFIDKALENEEILEGMLSMPDQVNRKLPSARRKEVFSFLWENTEMSQVETLNLVKQREREFIEEYKVDGVPEWMLRLEAQDILLKGIHEKFEEEGLI